MKPRIYLETTIPSYLTSRPSRDLVIAGHQQITRDWWEARRQSFQLFISQLVVDEASAGDAGAARERLKVIEAVPLLDITPEVAMLASNILASGRIPRKAAADAAHIAIAAVHGIEFLMTWNCVHIANAALTKALVALCRQQGFDCPVICTPEELLGE
ncbi:MAG TPA: type II toxin-antitoxin system VapC family toxin [Bryobacteraceae bacterium]|nr:type II toxin-antitoxin system VapC family toxin [Bryobacteraceae bacterium]